jgi:hypothetical protein
MPGESVCSPENPFCRTDSGVSLKKKNSYSAPILAVNPISAACVSTRCSTCRGETASGVPSRV